MLVKPTPNNMCNSLGVKVDNDGLISILYHRRKLILLNLENMTIPGHTGGVKEGGSGGADRACITIEK